jgi:hypothetical protein
MPGSRAPGAWWAQVEHAVFTLSTEIHELDYRNSPDSLLEWALWLAHRPPLFQRMREWWTQSSPIEALAALHAVDEGLLGVRPRPALATRLPVLQAELARLLDEQDPRRRDALRLIDRLVDQEDVPRSEMISESDLRPEGTEPGNAAAEDESADPQGRSSRERY